MSSEDYSRVYTTYINSFIQQTIEVHRRKSAQRRRKSILQELKVIKCEIPAKRSMLLQLWRLSSPSGKYCIWNWFEMAIYLQEIVSILQTHSVTIIVTKLPISMKAKRTRILSNVKKTILDSNFSFKLDSFFCFIYKS